MTFKTLCIFGYNLCCRRPYCVVCAFECVRLEHLGTYVRTPMCDQIDTYLRDQHIMNRIFRLVFDKSGHTMLTTIRQQLRNNFDDRRTVESVCELSLLKEKSPFFPAREKFDLKKCPGKPNDFFWIIQNDMKWAIIRFGCVCLFLIWNVNNRFDFGDV